MELLLFLSALLSGLTGAISGERRAEPAQVQRSTTEIAIQAAAEIAIEAAISTVLAPITPIAPIAAVAAPLVTLSADVAPLSWSRIYERRLE